VQHMDTLLSKITAKSIHIGIVGMGYVGLPLALTFVEQGQVRVTGFDVDSSKVQALSRGESYMMHLSADRISNANACSLFDATNDFNRLCEPDVLIIAVPTPLTPQREPDMRFIVQTAEAICKMATQGAISHSGIHDLPWHHRRTTQEHSRIVWSKVRHRLPSSVLTRTRRSGKSGIQYSVDTEGGRWR